MKDFFKHLSISLCAVWWLGLTPMTLAALPPQDSQGALLPSLAPMVEKTTPAVVNIATKSQVQMQDNPLLRDPFFRRFFDVPNMPRQRQTQSLGSGVIVDAVKGYVLTNAHVVDKADEITVTLRDGRTLNAKLIGSDREADVAVVQVPAENLTALPLADSGKLRVGDFVVAIGNPFGLGQTVTSGIVSALGRSGLGIEGYEDFIQTDASINPGNSGGALVNLRGELIGINTAIYAPSGGNVGIGFAIPINMARDIMTQIVTHGQVKRGRLGVAVQDITADLAKAFNLKENQGAVIAQVIKGGAADKAGIKTGDIVLQINGRTMRDAADLRNTVGLLRPGEQIKLDILRDGKPRQIKVTLGGSEPESRRAQKDSSSGNDTANLAGATIAPNEGEGMVVMAVDPASKAARAGLRPGDLIVSINRMVVNNAAEVQQALRAPNRGVLLNVRRGDGAMFIVIQ